MSAPVLDDFDHLLREARTGNKEALGRLLDAYGRYLRHVASTRLPADISPRKAPYDVVQDTYLDA